LNAEWFNLADLDNQQYAVQLKVVMIGVFMKLLKMLASALVLLCASISASATTVWTDNNAWGPGHKVTIVYPMFAEKAVMFKIEGSPHLYQYKWDQSQSEITPNAQVVYSTLMTAFTTKRKISFYYNSAESGQVNIYHINIHD
jgi:hypothetical protein